MRKVSSFASGKAEVVLQTAKRRCRGSGPCSRRENAARALANGSYRGGFP